jgi:hypothetical protein
VAIAIGPKTGLISFPKSLGREICNCSRQTTRLIEDDDVENPNSQFLQIRLLNQSHRSIFWDGPE